LIEQTTNQNKTVSDKTDYSIETYLLSDPFTCEVCKHFETSVFASPCSACVPVNFVYDKKANRWFRRKNILVKCKMMMNKTFDYRDFNINNLESCQELISTFELWFNKWFGGSNVY
jgi:hypothetical protein